MNKIEIINVVKKSPEHILYRLNYELEISINDDIYEHIEIIIETNVIGKRDFYIDNIKLSSDILEELKEYVITAFNNGELN